MSSSQELYPPVKRASSAWMGGHLTGRLRCFLEIMICNSAPTITIFASCPDRNAMAAKPDPRFKIVADNRKARFHYAIGEVFEAGIVLTGSEVKSMRAGKTSIAESYATSRDGELWLLNSNISEYKQAGRFNHEPKRPRKLLLHQRQISKLIGAVEREGMTVVPLKIYFNDKGRAKVEIALAKGKKLHDKRESEKQRDWTRERGRLLRDKG